MMLPDRSQACVTSQYFVETARYPGDTDDGTHAIGALINAAATRNRTCTKRRVYSGEFTERY